MLWARRAIWFLTFVAVFKGLHRPDRWGATQMETDYSAGFTKRGLLGELLRHLHVNHYNQIVVIAFVFTLLLVVQLIMLAEKKLLPVLGNPLFGALFLTSFALTYIVSQSGYLEVFLAVLTIGLLGMKSRKVFLVCALPASVAGVMIHELFLFVFVPVLALRALLQTPDDDAGRSVWEGKPGSFIHRMAGPGLLLLVACGVAIALSARPALSVDKIALLRHSLAARLDFAPREWVFAIFARSAGDNLRFMNALARTPRYWVNQVESIMMFGPPAAFFLYISLQRIRLLPEKSSRRSLQIAVVIASLAPLALHFMGYDTIRFNALVALCSFLSMAIVLERLGTPQGFLRTSWSYVAGFLVALNMGTGISLGDNGSVPLFPQMQSLKYGIQDASDILHHRPVALYYEPLTDIPWDPANPTFTGYQSENGQAIKWM